MKELFDFISRRIPLNGEIRDFTESISKVKEIKKGDKLITEGQYVNKTYFVVDGCLRSYVYDIKGKEHTLQFALKDHWITWLNLDLGKRYVKHLYNLTTV